MKLVRASAGYCAAGLLGGVYWRELTRRREYDTSSARNQLRIFHTHSFSLGSMFFLIVLALEKSFRLPRNARYKKFYVTYNIGLGITLLMMLVHGTLTVIGKDKNSRIISWVAGLGHVLMTVGFGYLYTVVHDCL